jgi:hypothetical protein
MMVGALADLKRLGPIVTHIDPQPTDLGVAAATSILLTCKFAGENGSRPWPNQTSV